MTLLQSIALRMFAPFMARVLSRAVVALALADLSWTRKLPPPFNADYDAQTFANITWTLFRQALTKLPLPTSALASLLKDMQDCEPEIPVERAGRV
jgi:hypothetical protein